MSGLVSADHRLGFIVINAGLFVLGMVVYVALVRRARPSAIWWMWGWVVLEIANGVGHLAIAAAQGAYMPGAATAPLLLATAAYLAAQLRPGPDVESGGGSRGAA